MDEVLKSENLRERVSAILRSKIITGELVPETLYSVSQFAEKLGVSPTPIREAVLDLANLGLLKIRKNRGFIVPALSAAQLEELHKIRTMLEIPATVEAAGKMTAADIETCRDLAQKSMSVSASGNLVEHIETDRRFHIAFLSPLNMPHLLDLIMTYRDRARLKRLPDMLGTQELEKSYAEHLKLVEAAEDGNLREVESLITSHLNDSKHRWYRLSTSDTA